MNIYTNIWGKYIFTFVQKLPTQLPYVLFHVIWRHCMCASSMNVAVPPPPPHPPWLQVQLRHTLLYHRPCVQVLWTLSSPPHVQLTPVPRVFIYIYNIDVCVFFKNILKMQFFYHHATMCFVLPIDPCEGHARRRWWLLLGHLRRWHKWRWGASRRSRVAACWTRRLNPQGLWFGEASANAKVQCRGVWPAGREIGDVYFFVEKCANDRTPIRSLGQVGLKVGLHRRTCPPLCNRSSDQNYCGASTVPPFRPC